MSKQSNNIKKRTNDNLHCYTCCYCRLKFNTKSDLSSHLYRHLKLFHEPDSMTTEGSGLDTAKKLFKTKHHPYFCAKCGKSFFNLAKAKQHCTRLHRGQSRIICLLFRKGKITNERKMLIFDEFAKEEQYISYDIDESSKKFNADTIPDVTTLHPHVYMRDVRLLNKLERECLMSSNGTKQWIFSS